MSDKCKDCYKFNGVGKVCDEGEEIKEYEQKASCRNGFKAK